MFLGAATIIDPSAAGITDPAIYSYALLTDPNSAAALDSVSPGLSTQIASQASPGESLLQAALRLAPTLVMANSQRQLLDVQLQRAQQGLPPLDASQYGVGVSVGLSPDVQKYLLIGGVALLAAIFILPRIGANR